MCCIGNLEKFLFEVVYFFGLFFLFSGFGLIFLVCFIMGEYKIKVGRKTFLVVLLHLALNEKLGETLGGARVTLGGATPPPRRPLDATLTWYLN